MEALIHSMVVLHSQGQGWLNFFVWSTNISTFLILHHHRGNNGNTRKYHKIIIDVCRDKKRIKSNFQSGFCGNMAVEIFPSVAFQLCGSCGIFGFLIAFAMLCFRYLCKLLQSNKPAKKSQGDSQSTTATWYIFWLKLYWLFSK